MTKSNQLIDWQRVFFGARTRILASYVVLMAFSMVVSVLVFRQALFARVDHRVKDSLKQEMKEFRQLVNNGKNPNTGKAFGNDVSALFNFFLASNVTDDDEYLLTILDGRLHRSSPTGVPEFFRGDSKFIKQWAQLRQPSEGRELTTKGKMIYSAEPVIIENEVRGVFVVAHLTAGEREEVDDAVMVIIQVVVFVLIVASVLAWAVAGGVLAPLRQLKETAQFISESDLKRRIPAKGVGEIAELSATFNAMLDRLEAAFASQREFLDDVGHELRTPITIIRGYLELLGKDVPEQQETIELVTDELDRMSRFVKDLLLLAKAENPNFLNLELVDIGLLTEELYSKVKALANRNWRLETKAKGRIVADRQRIAQAILELAKNATKHTQQGDEIALGSALINGKVRFWVRDTGEGISLAEQRRIFQRFTQISSDRSCGDGVGLGLAIVKAIANAHGGSVELISQPGVGSTFTLVLPLEPPQEVLL